MPEIWFGPNVASDVLELSTQPEFWPAARTYCSAVQLFVQQVLTDTDHEAEVNRVGPNRYPAFVANDFFRRLALPVTLEAGSRKDWSCDGVLAADGIVRAIQRVREAGGEISAVCFDEPIGPPVRDKCGQEVSLATAPVKHVMQAVRAAGVQSINIIEAYPYSSPSDILTLIGNLRISDSPPSGLHLDIDTYAFRDRGMSPDHISSDLRRFRETCGEWGITLGVVIIGQRPTDDRTYVTTSLDWAKRLHGYLGCWPDRLIIESWVERPGTKTLDFPHNLPEDNDSSHTFLLKSIGELVKS